MRSAGKTFAGACGGTGTGTVCAAVAIAISAAVSLAFTAAAVAGTVSAVAGAAPTSIELRPRVEVSQASVRLGDIAYLSGTDLSALRQLMALPLGAAPRPGAPKLLDRESVVRWVEARVAPQSVRWAGAADIEIASAAQPLAGESIVEAARAALQASLDQRGARASVQAASAPHDLLMPGGKLVLRVRPPALGTPLLDTERTGRTGLTSRTWRTWVWVDAWVDERFVRASAVAFDVAMQASDGDAAEERIATVEPGSVWPAHASGTSGTARPERAADVLAVRRGERAQLRVRSGDVAVESRVDVLQDGRPGQTVRIRVAGSSGEVLARVTGPGLVEVQP